MTRHIGMLVGSAALFVTTTMLPVYSQTLVPVPQPSPKQEQKTSQAPCTKAVNAAYDNIVRRANASLGRKQQFTYSNNLPPDALQDPQCFIDALKEALGSGRFDVSLKPGNRAYQVIGK